MSLHPTKNVESKSASKGMARLHMIDYDAARDAMEHLTVARAVRYLVYIFDSGTHELIFRAGAACPVDIACDPTLASLLAKHVRVQFWGGPPDDANWHKGTLLTLLMDNLFYCVAQGHNDVVDKFLRVLNHGKQNRETEADVPCGA